MTKALLLSLLLCVLAVPVRAQTAPSPAATVKRLAPVMVTGTQPGPGLWKVSKDGHVLWVLGTLTPLPKRMQWRSAQVEQALAQSQELLGMPTAKFRLDTGFFGKLLLLPAAYGARKNPDGATLQQLLPPVDYARWEALKRQYDVRGWGSERWRPIVAALELYKAALERDGLTGADDVARAVERLARRHGVKRVPVEYPMLIEHPRDAVATIRETRLRDTGCLRRTMDVVEHGMGALAARANAWSTGDLAALRSASLQGRHEACVVAVLNADFAQQLGLRDLPARIDDAWLDAARAALARNASTFALLPMDRLLPPNDLLAKLRAQGYAVQSPDDAEP